MATISEWWNTEYADEIMEFMRQKEETLAEFVAQSPQLRYRRLLVDWLALVVEKFKICNTACHLSVYLLDHFMSQHDIPETKLQLAAMACLSIACKFDERDSKVPRMAELTNVLNNVYSLQELTEMELFVLTFLDWELCIPTAAHFAEYFAQFASTRNDRIASSPLAMYSQVRASVELYIKYFLDISLQDCSFLTFKPSSVAAASIASTRMCLGLVPSWHQEIEQITKYSFEELIPLVEIMLRTLDVDQAAAARRPLCQSASCKRKLDCDSEDVPKKQSSPSEQSSPGSEEECGR